MRSIVLCTVLASTLLTTLLLAQPVAPQQITSGPGDDTHPAFVNLEYSIRNTCYLAFTRTTSKGSNICVLTCQDLQWLDSVDVVTDDSAGNDFASLSNIFSLDDSETVLLWQRGQEVSQIWYSIHRPNGWSTPARVTSDSGNERTPWVIGHDTALGAVWENNGRIVYADFINGAWTAPVPITPPGDSGNRYPVLNYSLVIWEKEKPDTNTHALMYAVRQGSVWSAPDTLAYAGDNRHPRFVRGLDWLNMLSYESNVTGDWEIYGISPGIGPDFWHRPATNVSANPTADDRHASFMNHPILLKPEKLDQAFGFLVGTWAVQSGTSDSILIAEFNTAQTELLTRAPGTTNRNPEISDGTDFWNLTRVWCVWENNSTGTWKLYASYRDIETGGVREERSARAFRLYQNYPNPFNPGTVVSFQLSVVSQVRIVVYDILGREVGTLVNEVKQPGTYEVRFDGSRLSSGVYFCRMEARPAFSGSMHFNSVQKLVLVK